MTASREEPVLIGWTEFVDLPEWGIKNLRAKVDTGARTSAVHVENIRELPRGFVHFEVILHRKKIDRRINVTARISRRGRVRSSTGHQYQRLFVKTKLVLGSVEKEIEVSLVDREKMIYRMLLGREALRGPFLIDVDRRMVQQRKKIKKKAKTPSKPKAKQTAARQP